MKKIYIAGPMFSQAELNFNEEVATVLEKVGFDVFLPQRAGYKMIDLLKEMSPDDARKLIFDKDYKAVSDSDIILIVLDGRVIDEGACIELGIGYALGKECYGLKTDPRSMMNGQINPMVSGCLLKVYCSLTELQADLELGEMMI